MTSTPRANSGPYNPVAGFPLPYQPQGRAMALAAALERLQNLEAELIAKLVAEWDAIEVDADFEPSLGAAERFVHHELTLDQRMWADGATDDREDDREE